MPDPEEPVTNLYPERSDNVERDHAMALAGHELRSKAAEYRERNKEIGSEIGENFAVDTDHMARHAERAAGEEYDAQSPAPETTQQYAGEDEPGPDANRRVEDVGSVAVGEAPTKIPVTDGSEDPYPDRVQDPEKAHSMAIAGHASRVLAADSRDTAKEAAESGWSLNSVVADSVADDIDKSADKFEERAGIQYDLAHGNEVSPEKMKIREKELLDAIDTGVDIVKQSIEELKKLRANGVAQSEDTSESTQAASDIPASKPEQTSEDFLAEQARTWSN